MYGRDICQKSIKHVLVWFVLGIVLWAVPGCSHSNQTLVAEENNSSTYSINRDVLDYLKSLGIKKCKLESCPGYEQLIKQYYIKSEDLEADVSEQEIEEYVDEIMDSYSELKKVPGRKTVKKGDFVRINYKTYYKGKLVSKKKGEVVKVGSGNYDKGLESVLPGMKTGRTYTKELVIPDNDIDKAMAGQMVQIRITVKSINKYVTPKLNDKFARKNLDCDSVEAFYQKRRETAKKEKETVAYIDGTNILFHKIAGKCKYDMNQDEVADYALMEVSHYEQLAYVENLSLEQYASQNDMTLDDLYQMCYETKEREIQKILTIGYLAEELNISTSSKEEYLEKSLAEKYLMIEKEVVKRFTL